MADVIKQFSISLDSKRPTSNRDFEVVDGDNGNVLEVILTDDGMPVDLDGCFILAVFSKSNGKTAAQDNRGNGIAVDEEQSNRLYIEMYTSSFAPGLVECELEIYSGEGQRSLVTTAKFNFMCRRGIANRDTIAKTDEWPVLVAMLDRIEGAEDELGQLNDETAQAAQLAHSAANRANEAVLYAENTITVMEAAEDAREQSEISRITEEAARIANETGRVGAESLRQSAESSRMSAESARQSAESARVIAEGKREENESARQSAESARVSAEAERSERSAALSLWADYDDSRTYVPLNKVAFGGSSYLCIAPISGVAPPNPSYWLLIAAKGADGMGAGDMLKSTYDKNNIGSVDDSQRLGGRPAADYLTGESDPTVPGWAKQPQKPDYSPQEIGAAAAADLTAHAGNTGNPHNVTASQVGAALPTQSLTATLLAAAWSDNRQTVAAACIMPESNVIFDIAAQATNDQYEAGKKANLSPSDQAAGYLTVCARGTVPAVDIPITVMVLG